jgi:hypothetical protein
MGEKRNMCMLLARKPEGKRPLGRPGCRWVDNIKMDLVEIGWGQVESSCEHGNKPSGVMKCWETIKRVHN